MFSRPPEDRVQLSSFEPPKIGFNYAPVSIYIYRERESEIEMERKIERERERTKRERERESRAQDSSCLGPVTQGQPAGRKEVSVA